MARAVTDPEDSTNASATSLVGPDKRTTSESARGGSDAPADEIARLRSEIAVRRQRLDTALNRLEDRVSEDLDWRRQVAAHPWLVMAAAALAGFAIGRLTARQPLPADRFRELEPT